VVDPLLQVHVIQGHASALGPAHPGIDQQQDDGGVAAAGEVPTLAGLEQPSLELAGQDWVAVGLRVRSEEPYGVGVGLDGPGLLFSASRVRRKLRLRTRR
jgi:hypothetical protein